MKKLIAVFATVVFVAGLSGYALAQAPAPEQKPMAGEKKAEKKMSAKYASGTVKSASGDSVVVAGKAKNKEAEWTFAVDPKTKIKKAGKDIAAGDLKAGDNVQVRYMEHDGKTVAQSITVRGGGMATKEGKAAK